ncbi:hypothetical protein [Sphaerisporangium corydalis]|uniref:Uncharacterized protein n=1 Tax=Sphaerisporangium corydalis TaxID=1441875 RepID=A0ABV9E8Y4_9ACTN|nr:hypothetical protein [Sphaerisporangium corydalis]
MAFDKLNRSNIAALWRYMPGQPYNWSSKGSVVGKAPRQVTPLDLPEGWVAPQLHRLLLPFGAANAGNPGARAELEVIGRGQFVLVKAEDLGAERFPNSFLCRVCCIFKIIQTGEPAPFCPTRNHGLMEQFSWCEVHECGHLEEISVPRCDHSCRAPMRLHNTRELQTSRWYWTCSHCQIRSEQPIVKWCTTCRAGRPQIMRVPQSSAYYPQVITVINPPTRNGYAELAHERVYAAAVAQSLGILPRGTEGLRLAAGGALADSALRQAEETAAALGLKQDDDLYEQLITRAKQQADDIPAWAAQVDALGRSPETIDAFGEECRQLGLAWDAAPLTVQNLLHGGADTPLESIYQQYKELFSQYKFVNVTLLRELPIAYIVAGYTRISGKAVSTTRRGTRTTTRFRFFPASRDSKFPMYGVRTDTEGLLFELDKLAVVEWLVDSGVVDAPGVNTQQDAQRWIYETVDPVTDAFSTPKDPVTKAILGLVHSMAHRTMKALAARCGLNVDSLAEFMFPTNCAFLIYANTRSEFTLGGLEHVYRFDLVDALRELDAEQRCVFDPPCRRDFGGACAACLHISEVACTRFNTVLDRNLLFGTLPPLAPTEDGSSLPGSKEDVRWVRYWGR